MLNLGAALACQLLAARFHPDHETGSTIMLGFKKPSQPESPRLKGHETDYQGSRGGWPKPAKKAVPSTPKKQPKR